MPVLGMGGLFFRAKDPDALNAWYRDARGVGAGCCPDPDAKADEWVWTVQGGPMVFAPFKADTDYFAAEKSFMINLRVSDIDSLIQQLNASYRDNLGVGAGCCSDPDAKADEWVWTVQGGPMVFAPP